VQKLLDLRLEFQAKQSSMRQPCLPDQEFIPKPALVFRIMAQCRSKVFFPDDPAQPPQFSDCPRKAETTRRTVKSAMKLCPKCAKVWDEEDRPIAAPKRAEDHAENPRRRKRVNSRIAS
jgi:hypothetical protein